MAAPLNRRQVEVLHAVADGRVQREWFFGVLAPHMLEGHDIGWVLRVLVVRGLVVLRPVGPPWITRRGSTVLKSSMHQLLSSDAAR